MIGDNIKHLRNSRGMTQEDLAEAIGVSDKAVSTWENNLKNPRMGSIQRMADYFGVTKSELIEGDISDKSAPVDLMDQLAREYGLSPGGRALLLAAAKVLGEIGRDNQDRMFRALTSAMREELLRPEMTREEFESMIVTRSSAAPSSGGDRLDLSQL